jgi:3',5'-nucleoside bisphosphate phosphatase
VRYRADLHIHTILSPCAEVEMIPPFIVATAIERGLDIIAITDHNSAENVEAVMQAAQGTSLKVLPGMECESVEGVHLVCLFSRVIDVLRMQEIVYEHLPDLPNKAETFGAQFVVDSEGEFIRYNERLLLIPTTLTIEEIVEHVKPLGGLVMPAHIDRKAYGIYGALGFLPDSPSFDVLEISRHITPDQARDKYPDIGIRKLFRSSDAHRLEEIGTGCTILDLPTRTLEALKQAIANPDMHTEIDTGPGNP